MCPMFLNQTKLWKKHWQYVAYIIVQRCRTFKRVFVWNCLFVCLGCFVHHYLWRSLKFDLYLTSIAIEQWGLLWHMVNPYNGNPRHNLTPIPVVEYLADRDSNPNHPYARRTLYHYATAAVHLYGEIYVYILIFRFWYNKKIMMIILHNIYSTNVYTLQARTRFYYMFIFFWFFCGFDSICTRGVQFYFIVSNYHFNIIDSI